MESATFAADTVVPYRDMTDGQKELLISVIHDLLWMQLNTDIANQLQDGSVRTESGIFMLTDANLFPLRLTTPWGELVYAVSEEDRGQFFELIKRHCTFGTPQPTLITADVVGFLRPVIAFKGEDLPLPAQASFSHYAAQVRDDWLSHQPS